MTDSISKNLTDSDLESNTCDYPIKIDSSKYFHCNFVTTKVCVIDYIFPNVQ